MSAYQSQQKKGSALGPGSFSFAPTISFESLCWSIISQIALSPVAIPDTGDTTRPHEVGKELVQWFDDVVHSVLTTSQYIEDYEKGRKRIIEAWAKESDHGKQLDAAHQLFRLTMETLSSKRLFKVKQYSYFRLGFIRGQGTPIEEIQEKESQFADDS